MSDRLHEVRGKIDDVIAEAAKSGPTAHALGGAAASPRSFCLRDHTR